MEESRNVLGNQQKFFNHRRSRKLKLHAFYPMDIQFYENIPPPITAGQLMKIVTERIHVLKIINSVERSIVVKNERERYRIIIERLTKIGSHRYIRLINSPGCRINCEETLQDRIIDHTSFVTLGLALISNEQLYEVFQRLEKKLFKLRLSSLDDKGINELLNIHNTFAQVDNNEKQKLQQQLIDFTDNPKDFQNILFFKVPVSLLLGIVNLHEVYFDKGTAFIPFDKIRFVFEGLFREKLEQQVHAINMNQLNHCSKIFDQSKKFSEILEEIRSKFFETQQYSLIGEKILASDIDELSVSSFPPCMRAIHEVLKSQHHLKHESRLQYTLFLKGIGLPVDEAIKLFKDEFLKRTSSERFDKEYKYYIEHAYGFRGNKNDYDPQDCDQIQNTPTAFGDCNGCFFSYNCLTDIEDLDCKLSQWQIPDNHRRKIIERTEKGNRNDACSYYFKIMNNSPSDHSVRHPNEYFFESRRIRTNKNDAVHFPIRESISNISTIDSSIDKTISKSNGAESVTSTTSMKNYVPRSLKSYVQNHQTLPRHYFKAIRPSMATFDELISIKNIKSGSIITYVPKSLDHFNTSGEISSDESPTRKRKRNK